MQNELEHVATLVDKDEGVWCDIDDDTDNKLQYHSGTIPQ